MLRFGIVLIACAVLILVTVRSNEPDMPAAVPSPVELVAEGRAPVALEPRTVESTARKVVRRRSSPRPALVARPLRAARSAAEPPVVAGPQIQAPASAGGGPMRAVEEPSGSRKPVTIRPRRSDGDGPAPRERPSAPITPPAPPAPGPAPPVAAAPEPEGSDDEEPAQDDPAEPAEEDDSD